VEASLPAAPGLKSITGHSMGGHGALTIAFKNPDAYAAVSAFAPICNPSAVPWGHKAFAAYLGDAAAGKAHDATELLAARGAAFAQFPDILIDQGMDDQFLAGPGSDPLAPQALSVFVLSPTLPSSSYFYNPHFTSLLVVETYPPSPLPLITGSRGDCLQHGSVKTLSAIARVLMK